MYEVLKKILSSTAVLIIDNNKKCFLSSKSAENKLYFKIYSNRKSFFGSSKSSLGKALKQTFEWKYVHFQKVFLFQLEKYYMTMIYWNTSQCF